MPFSGKVPKPNQSDYQEPAKEPIRDGRPLLAWQSAKASLVARGMSDTEAREYLADNPGSMKA